MTHSYQNPSDHVDTSAVESDNSGMVDEHGFTIRPPISDRECIYKCLDNCIALAGLDKHQVERLAKQFNPNNSDEVDIESEYPPL